MWPVAAGLEEASGDVVSQVAEAQGGAAKVFQTAQPHALAIMPPQTRSATSSSACADPSYTAVCNQLAGSRTTPPPFPTRQRGC